MDNIQTQRTKSFDFQQALVDGKAIDHRGQTHTIIASGDEHMITQCNGNEYCFNKQGEHLATFGQTKLVEPSIVEEVMLSYIVYNVKTLEILGMANGVMAAWRMVGDNQDPDIDVINITHPKNKDILAQLGITKTRWLVTSDEAGH